MTTLSLSELQQRVEMTWVGYGTYRISTTYRGQQLTAISHNTLAVDRIHSDDSTPARKEVGYYTLRGAYQALHDEVLMKNQQ